MKRSFRRCLPKLMLGKKQVRTAYLESEGLTVIRSTNHDVLTNIDGVVRIIIRLVAELYSEVHNRSSEGSK